MRLGSTTHTALDGSSARKMFGLLRLAAGILVATAIITQISDEIAHSAFIPREYFSYFTIESSIMNVVVLLVGAAIAFSRRQDTELFTSVRLAILSYAVVTGVVYNLLLRNLPSDGGYEAPRWPNEVMHVWVPLFIVVDWFLAPGKERIPWRRLWLVVGYPLTWLAFTLVRGAVSGWYPYPFLEPSGPAGIVGVVSYIVAIAAFIVGIACAALSLSRLRERMVKQAHSTGRPDSGDKRA